MSQQPITASYTVFKDTVSTDILHATAEKSKSYAYGWNPATTTIMGARIVGTQNHDWPCIIAFYMNDQQIYYQESTATTPADDSFTVDVMSILRNGAQDFLVTLKTTFSPFTVKFNLILQIDYIGVAPKPPEEKWFGLTKTQWIMVGGGAAAVIGLIILLLPKAQQYYPQQTSSGVQPIVIYANGRKK